jgi:hypothetical protein
VGEEGVVCGGILMVNVGRCAEGYCL